MDNEKRKIEKPLCPHCFTEYEDGVDFCKECGCPLGGTVGYDPIKRILSQGWAVSGPSSKVILVAMWLIFGAQIPILLLGLPSGNSWPLISVGIIYIIILYRVTKNYLKYKEK